MAKALLGRDIFACRSGGDVGGFGIFGLLGNDLFLFCSRECSSKDCCLKPTGLFLFDLAITNK